MARADRPRVGYVLKMYPRFSETFSLSEILAHEAAGCEVHIFSLRLPSDGRFHETLAKVRATVSYLPYDSLRGATFWQDIARHAKVNPRLWDCLPACTDDDAHEVHQAAALSTMIRERGITHLHAHFATSAAMVAMHAASMSEITCSFTAHAKDIYADDVDHDRMRRLLRGSSRVVTVSNYNLDHFRTTYGTDAEHVVRIYNGLHIDSFPYSDPTHREPEIIGVGRLVEKKGFACLIDACAALRDRGRSFRCRIIGDGPLATDLHNRIRERGLESCVHLLGALPQGRVIECVSRARVLAAPCVIGADGNRDGLPTVLLEAMALGTPCVSTDVTGITEAVQNGETGLIVPQHDAVSLALALERMIDDHAMRARIATRARAVIEHDFDITKNTTRLRDVFFGARTPAGAIP